MGFASLYPSYRLVAPGRRPLEVWVLGGIGVVVVAIFVTAVVLALGKSV